MQKRFDVLDSFRGIAAMIIIVHHIHYQNSIAEWLFFINGQLFVEMFFVLSGFVLAHSYTLKKTLNFRDFFISRTFRIFPLHIFMLLLLVLPELVKYIAYQYGITFNHMPFSGNNALINLPVHLLLLQSWIPNTGDVGFNPPAWSISVEYYMYMIFFLSLLISREKRKIVWAIIFISAFILLVSDLINLGYFVNVFRGLSSFFLGSLIYLFYKKYSYTIQKLPARYYSIAEVFIVVLIIYIVSSSIENHSIIISFLFTLQIFVFSLEKGVISTLLKKKVFLHIGKLSYSIYLIHYFILLMLQFGSTVLVTLGFPITDIIHKNPNLTILLIVLTVIYLSNYTYKYIELKWQNIGKKLR